jgi:enediyne biosynthesis protein E4
MFVANYGQAPLLYRNLSRGLGNHWLRLELEGTQSNRDAVGARVTVYAKGLRPQVREVQIGQGLGSCNERTLHFGLARAGRAERVEIRWPSGRHQVLKAVDSNQTLHIVEPGRSRWI